MTSALLNFVPKSSKAREEEEREREREREKEKERKKRRENDREEREVNDFFRNAYDFFDCFRAPRLIEASKSIESTSKNHFRAKKQNQRRVGGKLFGPRK